MDGFGVQRASGSCGKYYVLCMFGMVRIPQINQSRPVENGYDAMKYQNVETRLDQKRHQHPTRWFHRAVLHQITPSIPGDEEERKGKKSLSGRYINAPFPISQSLSFTTTYLSIHRFIFYHSTTYHLPSLCLPT